MIFQDPISSLNPRRKVRDIVMEPLDIWKRGNARSSAARVDAMLEEVGIDPQRAAESQPHQFSGGQCQRISHRPLARARPDADHLRRAGVGARRERAGPGAQPARGPEGQVRLDADVHRPRPGRRQEHQRPRGGDVPRQALRGGAERRSVRRAGPSTTRTCCCSRSPSPIRIADHSVADRRRRAAVAGATRRQGAASTPAARTPTSCAAPRSRSCGRWATTTSSPATIRWSPRWRVSSASATQIGAPRLIRRS